MEERARNPFRESLPDATGLLNAHGTPTYRRNLEEQVIRILMTNTLEGTFYASRPQITLEALEILFEIRRRDPQFLAKALIYARNTGFLRLINIVGLAVLSTSYNTAPFLAAFNRVIQIPDDVRDFIMVCESGRVRRGYGGVAVEAVKNWLNNMSEFHAIKYSGKNGMRRIINRTHPKPSDRTMEERFGWAVYGWSDVGEEPSPTNPQIWAYERLKRATDEPDIIEAIRAGRLPWEVVVPVVKKMTLGIREELMRQMGFDALLRNLNNLERNGVFENPDNLRFYISRITDPIALRRAKVFPFRLYQAWRAYKSKSNHNPEIAHALETAMENSIENIPTIAGRAAIGSDVSGSMSGTITRNSKVRYIDICGIYTAALYKKLANTLVIPFEGFVVDNFRIDPEDSVLAITEKLADIGGGQTAVGAPIQHLIDNNIDVDIFIGITDNEDWAYGYGHETRGSFLELWGEYKATHPQAKAFLITITPDRSAVAPPSVQDVYFIYGWSSDVVNYISLIASGGISQLDDVRSIQL